MLWSIYKIENTVNAKLYVGCTTLPLENRLREHILHALNVNNDPSGGCFAIYSAIREYGAGQFSINLIESGNGNKNTMFSRESYWIRHFASMPPNGYNLRARLLADEQVAIIRYDACNLTQVAYAELFGVCAATIAVAKHGRGSTYRADPYAYITKAHLPEDIPSYVKQFRTLHRTSTEPTEREKRLQRKAARKAEEPAA